MFSVTYGSEHSFGEFRPILDHTGHCKWPFIIYSETLHQWTIFHSMKWGQSFFPRPWPRPHITKLATHNNSGFNGHSLVFVKISENEQNAAMASIDEVILKTENTEEFIRNLMSSLVQGIRSSNSIPTGKWKFFFSYFVNEFKTIC
jgi:hypothetical protein